MNNLYKLSIFLFFVISCESTNQSCYTTKHLGEAFLPTQSGLSSFDNSIGNTGSQKENCSFDIKVKRNYKKNYGKKFYEFEEIHSIINDESQKKGIDPDLIRAIVRVESNFQSNVISKAGAIGLMQIMPETAKYMHVKNLFDPKENIQAGIKFFLYLLREFKDINLAIAAYNAGPGTIKRFGGIPPYLETQKYVFKVRGFYAKYKKM